MPQCGHLRLGCRLVEARFVSAGAWFVWCGLVDAFVDGTDSRVSGLGGCGGEEVKLQVEFRAGAALSAMAGV